MMPDKMCFVIMPFSASETCTEDEWTSVFTDLFSPAVEGAGLGLTCVRSKPATGDLIQDIVQMLHNAEIVIADLTDQNANVMWELGVRHSLRTAGTILLTQHEDDVPTNLRSYSWHQYEWGGPQDKERFHKKLKPLLKQLLINLPDTDNPVGNYLLNYAPPTVTDFADEASYFQDVLETLKGYAPGAAERIKVYIDQTSFEELGKLEDFKAHPKVAEGMEAAVRQKKVVIDYTFLFLGESSVDDEAVRGYLKPYRRFANSISVMSRENARTSWTQIATSIALLPSQKIVYLAGRMKDGTLVAPRKVRDAQHYQLWREKFDRITVDSKQIHRVPRWRK